MSNLANHFFFLFPSLRSLLQKLPDKGKKIHEFVEKVTKLIEQKSAGPAFRSRIELSSKDCMNMEQSSISSGTEFSTTVDDISTDSLESKQPKTFDQSSYSSVTKSAPDITNSLSDHFQVIL